jgi:hypothetical protein
VRILYGNKIKTSKILLNKDKHTNDNLVLFHQNIRGLAGKIDELKCLIISKSINPHLIYLSEHYMTDFKISHSHFPNYLLGTSYACKTHQGGRVCIYVRSDIDFVAINLTQFCEENNIEICALKFAIAETSILVVLCIYRSPCGNFEYFVKQLDKVLKLLYKSKIELIICGDFNVDFLKESVRRCSWYCCFNLIIFSIPYSSQLELLRQVALQLIIFVLITQGQITVFYVLQHDHLVFEILPSQILLQTQLL